MGNSKNEEREGRKTILFLLITASSNELTFFPLIFPEIFLSTIYCLYFPPQDHRKRILSTLPLTPIYAHIERLLFFRSPQKDPRFLFTNNIKHDVDDLLCSGFKLFGWKMIVIIHTDARRVGRICVIICSQKKNFDQESNRIPVPKLLSSVGSAQIPTRSCQITVLLIRHTEVSENCWWIWEDRTLLLCESGLNN